jgi:hypothetical protein
MSGSNALTTALSKVGSDILVELSSEIACSRIFGIPSASDGRFESSGLLK